MGVELEGLDPAIPSVVSNEYINIPTAKVVIAHTPNMPPTCVMQDNLTLAKEGQHPAATPQEVLNSTQLMVTDSPTDIKV